MSKPETNVIIEELPVVVIVPVVAVVFAVVNVVVEEVVCEVTVISPVVVAVVFAVVRGYAVVSSVLIIAEVAVVKGYGVVSSVLFAAESIDNSIVWEVVAVVFVERGDTAAVMAINQTVKSSNFILLLFFVYRFESLILKVLT